MSRPIRFNVSITPEGSPFVTYVLAFSQRSIKGNEFYARAELPKSIFVVEGEQLSIELRPVGDSTDNGVLQQNAHGNVRVKLIGDEGTEDLSRVDNRITPRDASPVTSTRVLPDFLNDPNVFLTLGGLAVLVYMYRGNAPIPAL